jgi:FkbM family methyltransferase
MKISRHGKTFFVTGNVDYFIYWKNKFWEVYTHKVFDRFLDPNHSYIDIGAFIGPTVLYGAFIAKKVYAIEPDPVAFSELEKNVSLNPALKEKIELHQKCINVRSEKVKFGSISDGGDSMSSLLFADSKTSWVVDGITFDDFIKNNNITDCNFIKMDIEGGEAFVLPTMENYLKIHKPVLYLSIHPCFFENPREDIKKVIDVLEVYKNVYRKDKKIELNELLSKKGLIGSYEVVATDENWNK